MKNGWRICFLFPVALIGCVVFSPVDQDPGDERQKNLEAVRALLSDPSSGPSGSSPDHPSRQGKSVPWPPDWLEGYFAASAAPQDYEDSLPSLSSPSDRIMPSRSSARDLKVTIPWKPTQSPPIVPQEPFHPIPPYFHPTPVVPSYPNSLRCVPDLYGGQRCR
ncbi:MAG TPA: hypothetical protein VHF07_02815 [Nitrospiraceae bacterium]|nr:hypothetical protein [Nitrospiraceae bacterium]